MALEEARKAKAEQEARREAEAKIWTDRLRDFQATREERQKEASISFQAIPISDDLGELDVSVYPVGDVKIVVKIVGCLRAACILHWGCVGVGGEVRRRLHGDWQCPPPHLRPVGTVVIDASKAVQTPLTAVSDRPFEYCLLMEFPASPRAKGSEHDTGFKAEFGAISFVLKEAQGMRWFKARDGKDVMIRLETSASASWQGTQKALVEKIVEAEVEWDHMTLMHRYQHVAEIMDSNFDAAKKASTQQESKRRKTPKWMLHSSCSCTAT